MKTNLKLDKMKKYKHKDGFYSDHKHDYENWFANGLLAVAVFTIVPPYVFHLFTGVNVYTDILFRLFE